MALPPLTPSQSRNETTQIVMPVHVNGTGSLMFGGTIGAIGGIRPGTRFEMELEDPVLQRKLGHAYDIEALPVVA